MINKFKDSIFKNSFYILAARVVSVSAGFLFWIVAARLYSVENISFATVFISSSGLVLLLSRLGLNISLIRFFSKNKEDIFNTFLTLTIIASFIIGIIYLIGIEIFSPKLVILKTLNNSSAFLAITIMSSITLITVHAFIALRDSKHYLYQSIILSLKVPFLTLFVFFGGIGIIYAIILSYIFALILDFSTIKRFIRVKFHLNINYIKEALGFSFGNYLAVIIMNCPPLILPILILNLLGETNEAKYYIAFTIGNTAMIISDSVSSSLMAEGFRGDDLRSNFSKSIFMVYSILIPFVLILILFAGDILNLFGKSYFESIDLLKLIALSSLLATVASLFITFLIIRLKILYLMLWNILTSIMLLGFSYLFILRFGIIGVGYSWIITYAILDIFIAAIFVLRKISKSSHCMNRIQ